MDTNLKTFQRKLDLPSLSLECFLFLLIEPVLQVVAEPLGVLTVQGEGVVVADLIEVDVGQQDVQLVRSGIVVEAELVSTAVVAVLTPVAVVEPGPVNCNFMHAFHLRWVNYSMSGFDWRIRRPVAITWRRHWWTACGLTPQ